MTTHQPQVGDTITTAEELDELFSGTVVLDSRGDAYLLGAVTTRYAARNPPLTILYLPGHPPRPEREVKAEALREAAARCANRADDNGSNPAAGAFRSFSRILHFEADEIEAGETR